MDSPEVKRTAVATTDTRMSQAAIDDAHDQADDQVSRIRNLYAAVLNQAIYDLRRPYVSSSYETRENYCRAVEWFRTPTSLDSPITFVQACSVLDLDPATVVLALERKGLLSSVQCDSAQQQLLCNACSWFLGAVGVNPPYGPFF
jgi:hypothetical protein